MKKISVCCNSFVHVQEGTYFCSNCIRILGKSEVYSYLKPLITIITMLLFYIMVFNSSIVYAPINDTLNWFSLKKEKLNQTKYAIDCIQVKIIEGNNSNAVSIKGAYGDMQIMPVTLDDWNKKHPNQQYTMDDMKNEIKNVRVGKWMLERRIPEILKSKKVPLTINHVLIAYNWGCGNLVNWFRSGSIYAELPLETQQYICKYWAKAKI